MNHFVNHQQLLNHKIIKCGRDSTCCPRWRKVRPLTSYDYRNRVTRHTHTQMAAHTGDVPGPIGDLSTWTQVGPKGDGTEGVLLGEVRPAFLPLSS